MKPQALIAVLVVLALLGGGWWLWSQRPPASEPPAREAAMSGPRTGAPTVNEPAGGGHPLVIVETSLGTFKIELFLKEAPITAGNFLKLVERGFYNGLVFHRVVKGFVIQAGDPFCTAADEALRARCGQGGPGWTIPLEIVPTLKHDAAGVVAMARTQDPDSAGSQFYVTLQPTPFLDGQYAVFGRVVAGLEVVMRIGSVPVDARSRPLEDVVLRRVYLEA